MAGTTAPILTPAVSAEEPTGSPLVRWMLTSLAVMFLGLFVVVPVVNVFTQAMSKGISAYTRTCLFPPPDRHRRASRASSDGNTSGNRRRPLRRGHRSA